MRYSQAGYYFKTDNEIFLIRILFWNWQQDVQISFKNDNKIFVCKILFVNWQQDIVMQNIILKLTARYSSAEYIIQSEFNFQTDDVSSAFFWDHLKCQSDNVLPSDWRTVKPRGSNLLRRWSSTCSNRTPVKVQVELKMWNEN